MLIYMKKFLLLSALALSSLAVSAQVEVDSLSRLIVGNIYPFQPEPILRDVSIGGGSMFDPITLDSNAKICVIGKGKEGTGGRISFGANGDAYIQQRYTSPYSPATYNTTKYLELYGVDGVAILGRTDSIASLFNAKTNKYRFYCDVNVDGLFVNSDSRLKTNIEELSESDRTLSAINAISYNLTRGRAASSEMTKASAATEEGAAAPMPADDRTRFGFVAQQVREVFPELVAEDENGYLSVDYIGFIPLLVDAVNALTQKVEDQQKIIDTLTRGAMKKAGANDELLGPSLSQNRPNPFTNNTVIDCTLPSDIMEAALFIYDMQGKQLLRIPIADRGNTSVTVEARKLGAGMYIYALIADGVEIDSRRMIINE